MLTIPFGEMKLYIRFHNLKWYEHLKRVLLDIKMINERGVLNFSYV